MNCLFHVCPIIVIILVVSVSFLLLVLLYAHFYCHSLSSLLRSTCRWNQHISCWRVKDQTTKIHLYLSLPYAWPNFNELIYLCWNIFFGCKNHKNIYFHNAYSNQCKYSAVYSYFPSLIYLFCLYISMLSNCISGSIIENVPSMTQRRQTHYNR